MSEENNKIDEQDLENPTSEKDEQVSESPKEKEEEVSPEDLICLLYTSPSPRDRQKSRMPSSA